MITLKFDYSNNITFYNYLEEFQRHVTIKDWNDIMLSSLSDSTLKNYDGTLKTWWQFCAKKNARPPDLKAPDVLDFFTQEYHKGLSHSTLNAMRSAISLIAKIDIGNNEHIKWFFKGISNAHPSRPKYAYTWGPKTVLNFFKKHPSNEKLSSIQLSKKLITLLALINYTSTRSSIKRDSQ